MPVRALPDALTIAAVTHLRRSLFMRRESLLINLFADFGTVGLAMHWPRALSSTHLPFPDRFQRESNRRTLSVHAYYSWIALLTSVSLG